MYFQILLREKNIMDTIDKEEGNNKFMFLTLKTNTFTANLKILKRFALLHLFQLKTILENFISQIKKFLIEKSIKNML
ncbi:hypothetical protein M153_1441000991 [Pseudoloma neurophilia]|uniref:Uncharacterized protein n=1 Tax=Pseudoloma neurophilia TaxID=146866 RepID=A0A0R0M2V1_9MICR|nr:hypothetical protein M153_1441000991 [Pseudoloma neurophilia]